MNPIDAINTRKCLQQAIKRVLNERRILHTIKS